MKASLVSFAAKAQTMDHSAVIQLKETARYIIYGYSRYHTLFVHGAIMTDFTERTKLPGWLWLSRMRKDPSPCEVRRALARLLEISPW